MRLGQGHSRSLEPTQINRLPESWALFRTVSEINGDFRLKSHFFLSFLEELPRLQNSKENFTQWGVKYMGVAGGDCPSH